MHIWSSPVCSSVNLNFPINKMGGIKETAMSNDLLGNSSSALQRLYEIYIRASSLPDYFGISCFVIVTAQGPKATTNFN